MSPRENQVIDFVDEDEGVPIPGTDGQLEAVSSVKNSKRKVFKIFAAARALRGSENPVLRIVRKDEIDAQNHMQYLKRKSEEYLSDEEREAGDWWHLSSSGQHIYVTLLSEDEEVPYA